MIDWLTFKTPLRLSNPIKGFIFSKIDEDSGELIFQKGVGRHYEGSASSSIYLTSDSDSIFISGNPVKFLQGHNLFGVDEPKPLIRDLLMWFYTRGILSFNLTDLEPSLMNTDLFRTDINYAFDLRTNMDVNIFIDAMFHQAQTRQGKATRDETTCYLGKKSRRYSFKSYNKFLELQTNKEHKKLANYFNEYRYNLIINEANGLLRNELTLRALELKDKNLKNLKNWNKNTAKEVYKEYMNKITIKGNAKLTDEQMFKLPTSLRQTYFMWRDGYPIRPNDTMTRTTFYRHRKLLLEHGININIPKDRRSNRNRKSTDLVRVLIAKPYEPSQAFIDAGLLYESEPLLKVV